MHPSFFCRQGSLREFLRSRDLSLVLVVEAKCSIKFQSA